MAAGATPRNVRVPDKAPERDAMRKGVLFDILKADWRTDVDYDGFDYSAPTCPRTARRKHPSCGVACDLPTCRNWRTRSASHAMAGSSIKRGSSNTNSAATV